MDTYLGVILGLVGTALGVVITKMIDNYYENKKQPKLFIADINHIIKWNWTGRDLLRRLIALDYETTEYLNEAIEGTSDQWAPVFMNNPECWRLLAYRDKELVGYWSFFALNDPAFENAKLGILNENEITVENVVPMDKPGVYNIFISMICIKEGYREQGLDILINSFIEQLNELITSGREIDKICLNAVSDPGKVLAKNSGLKEIGPHKVYGSIYFGSYEDTKHSKRAKGKLK